MLFLSYDFLPDALLCIQPRLKSGSTGRNAFEHDSNLRGSAIFRPVFHRIFH